MNKLNALNSCYDLLKKIYRSIELLNNCLFGISFFHSFEEECYILIETKNSYQFADLFKKFVNNNEFRIFHGSQAILEEKFLPVIGKKTKGEDCIWIRKWFIHEESNILIQICILEDNMTHLIDQLTRDLIRHQKDDQDESRQGAVSRYQKDVESFSKILKLNEDH